LPPVQKVHRDLKAKGFEVVLINFRENPDLVRRTVKERGYTAPVLLDESGDVTGKVYGVWGPPTVYLIDRQGRLAGRATGPRPWDGPAGRRLVEALLASP
jgi:AhpC/TSA family